MEGPAGEVVGVSAASSAGEVMEVSAASSSEDSIWIGQKRVRPWSTSEDGEGVDDPGSVWNLLCVNGALIVSSSAPLQGEGVLDSSPNRSGELLLSIQGLVGGLKDEPVVCCSVEVKE